MLMKSECAQYNILANGPLNLMDVILTFQDIKISMLSMFILELAISDRFPCAKSLLSAEEKPLFSTVTSSQLNPSATADKDVLI